MPRETKKRIDTNAESLRPNLNPAFAKLDLPNLPSVPANEFQPGGGNASLSSPGNPWKLGRVMLRRETAHRGGKTVIVVHDFATHLPGTVIEAAAKRIRAACGCGGTIRDRSIEVQGDQAAKIRAVLEAEGFQVAGVR